MGGRPAFVIAGGGTAGHTVPAIAIARALVTSGVAPTSIRFVGGQRGSEGRLVPEAGFGITLLPGRGIERRLSAANFGAAAGLVMALARALILMGRWRPRAVISVGGYAGFAAAVAAVVWRRPLVLAEQNAVPGASNKVVARWAKACATSFSSTPLPRAALTGNPVRAEVLAVDRSDVARRAARAALGLPEGRVVIGVSGGSLGARRVNDAVRGMARAWAVRDDIAIYHAVGRRDWPGFEAPELLGLYYRAVEYEERIDLVLAAADLWIGRAGGSTCAELMVCGIPGVLVPLPGAPGDHQTANARAMEAAGAAVWIKDGDCTVDRLAEVVGGLVGDEGRRAAMSEAGIKAGRRDAAERVAALVLEHARA